MNCLDTLDIKDPRSPTNLLYLGLLCYTNATHICVFIVKSLVT